MHGTSLNTAAVWLNRGACLYGTVWLNRGACLYGTVWLNRGAGMVWYGACLYGTVWLNRGACLCRGIATLALTGSIRRWICGLHQGRDGSDELHLRRLRKFVAYSPARDTVDVFLQRARVGLVSTEPRGEL